MKESTTTWFLWTDSRGNAIIARNAPETNAQEGIQCFDKENKPIRLNLWEVPYSLVSEFVKNERRWKFPFRVFKRTGLNSKIVEAPEFLFEKRPVNIKHVEQQKQTFVVLKDPGPFAD